MAGETTAVDMGVWKGVGTFGSSYLSKALGRGTGGVRRCDQNRINGRPSRSLFCPATRALPVFSKMFTSQTIGTRQGNRQLVHFFIVLRDTCCAAAGLTA